MVESTGEVALNVLRRLAAFLFVLAMPVLFFTSSVRYAANELRLYHYSFDRYNVEARTGIARSELDQAAIEIVRYFNSNDKVLDIRVQQQGRGVSLFTEKETKHMVDVKTLVQRTFRVQELALVYVLGYVVVAFVRVREASPRALAKLFLAGGGLTLAIVTVVGLTALINFDAFWERFHIVVFPNDLWQLNPNTDRLIQMFPEGFWMDASLLVVGLTALGAGITAGAAALYLRLTAAKGAASPEKRILSRQRTAVRRQ